MPDPKKPSGAESEPEEEAHGGAIAKTFQEIENDLASEGDPPLGGDEETEN